MGAETRRRSYIYCPQCGKTQPLYAKFCGACGTALPARSAELALPQTVQPLRPAPLTQAIMLDDPVESSPASNVNAKSLYPFMPDLLKQRYRILDRIGAGGYGQVFRAVDTEFMQRQVAIKEMIQHGLSAQELSEATESFQREAMLLAALTHPNLPSIYDFFAVDGNWYVVMSFIEGVTLDVYVQQKGGRLTVEKALQIGIQLAGVLSYLHTRKPAVIFRDLKPTNVMRTPEGQLYLIDFGIARHFKQGQRRDTQVLGSPGYAAPEQYGQRQTTPQADIYSLGALLHELISGKSPTQAPFRQTPLTLPLYPQLALLIQCMLELDVKKRPASMLNIQHELQRMASGHVRPITDVHPAVSTQHRAVVGAQVPPPAVARTPLPVASASSGPVPAVLTAPPNPNPNPKSSAHAPLFIARVRRSLVAGWHWVIWQVR
jgi:Serine/threonine protein kinase